MTDAKDPAQHLRVTGKETQWKEHSQTQLALPGKCLQSPLCPSLLQRTLEVPGGPAASLPVLASSRSRLRRLIGQPDSRAALWLGSRRRKDYLRCSSGKQESQRRELAQGSQGGRKVLADAQKAYPPQVVKILAYTSR